MAQLSDDCFAHGGRLLSLGDAQAALTAAASQDVGEVYLPLAELAGRVLSRPVVAMTSVPPFRNSAVDGYAYAHGTSRAQVIGTIAAGDPDGQMPLAPGNAVRILTGAPMPPGADTVVMDEDAAWQGQDLILPPQLKAGSNVRPQGEDIRAQEVLYPRGSLLRPLDLARLATGGLEGAWVARPLRIHVLSSGDEIRNGQVADANRWLLAAVFEDTAFEVSFGGVVPDDRAASIAALETVQADLILTSGGVSVGERDFLRSAIEALGSLEFWKVGIKPGRPVAFGQVRGTPIFGLPGNPVACFITAQFLALPYALAKLGGVWHAPTFTAPLGADIRKKGHRTEFVRMCLDDQGRAHPYAVAGAGIISSLTQADALAILDDEVTELPAGAPVPLLAMKGVLS